MSPRRNWSATDLETLRALYADTPTRQLARQLGRTVPQVYAAAEVRGLKKSAAYLASEAAGRLRKGAAEAGKATRFKPGQKPANLGLRRPGWAPGRMAETQFKKGRPAQDSRNYRPIGSLRISKDGYLVRKVTDDPALVPARRWEGVHRLVWMAAHGPIPAGHVVTFKPGRRTIEPDDITLDALELLTLAENMRRNSYHTRYPKEIGLLIQARGALQRVINHRTENPAK